MPNAKENPNVGYERIILAGNTGTGKTTQILTLPGKKFVYIFDPNCLRSIRGHDVDYEEFLPESTELDSTLKGFNKGARDDKPASEREPTLYLRWVEDLNKREQDGKFKEYDWIIFDSLTFLAQSLMDRQLYINNRYGKVEDLGDYRVVGSKLSDVFRTITSLPVNIYATGHLTSYQDEKTKKTEVQLQLPGKARVMLPLVCTNIWLAMAPMGEEGKFQVQTRPDQRGLQTIRSTISGLKFQEDVTIADFTSPEDYGIGALLARDIKEI